MHYQGVVKVDEATTKVLQLSPEAKTTNYGDQYFFTSPFIETSSEKFKWMETSLWIAQGHWVVDDKGWAVEYEIYRAVN